jgi:hypothetical protein
MADYFTSTSFDVRATPEQHEWLERLHGAVCDRFNGDEPEVDPDIQEAYAALESFEEGGIDNLDYVTELPEPPHIWVCGDAEANCDYIAALMQQFLRHFDLPGAICFQWASHCSKPIPDSFGGGAFVVTKDAIEGMTSGSWAYDTMKRVGGEEAAEAFAKGGMSPWPLGAVEPIPPERLARALRYAAGCMTPDDADDIRYECQQVGGCYPLEWLTVDGMMETVTELFGDSPEVREIVADACARVHNKWDSDGHLKGAAEDWAMNLIKERAEELGLTDSSSDEVAASDVDDESEEAP